MNRTVKLILFCTLLTMYVLSAPLDEFDDVDSSDDDLADLEAINSLDGNDDDIEYTDEQMADYTDNNYMVDIEKKYKWPRTPLGNILVPIVIRKKDYTPELLAVFGQAMADIEENTCIRFVPRKDRENYIKVKDSKTGKCSSKVGKAGGKQHIWLSPWCMSFRKKCVHELMHSLGFTHMHQRYDRDTALTIVWDNVEEEKRKYFVKWNNKWEAYNTPYDPLSCMHYTKAGFSKNGETTIITKDPQYQDLIGTQPSLSEGDIKRINRMYRCTI